MRRFPALILVALAADVAVGRAFLHRIHNARTTRTLGL